MKRKTDYLADHALISRLKAYYDLLPKGYMDTLVGMAMADSTGNPPNGEREKGHFPCGRDSDSVARENRQIEKVKG